MRATNCASCLAFRMSLGSVSAIESRVSEAIQSQADEALDVARAAAVKHTDGTSWRPKRRALGALDPGKQPR